MLDIMRVFRQIKENKIVLYKYHLRSVTSILMAALVSFLPFVVEVGASPLDPTFGNGGSVVNQFIVPPYHFSANARDVAVQPDGKVVIAGTLSFVLPHIIVVRHNSDGSRDSSFGTGGEAAVGFVGSQAYGNALVIQPDGSIVVVGSIGYPSYEIIVLRFGADGSYDNSFGNGGIVRMNVGGSNEFWRKDIALQSDGKIIVAGDTPNGSSIVRLSPNGSIDTTFDTDGIVSVAETVAKIAVQQDGKIVAVGNSQDQAILARFNTDGSPDTTFDSDGVIYTALGSSSGGYFSAVAVQPDGRIVATGAGSDMYDDGKEYYLASLVRYLPSGDVDTSFNGNGVVRLFLYGQFNSLAIRSNGQIIAAGGYLIGRFGASGSVHGVTSPPLPRPWFDAVALQPDGKIVASGASTAGQYTTSSDILVARFLPDVTVSGRVLTPGGLGVRNVTVILTDQNGVRRTATTSSFGNYMFENVTSGDSYTLTVASKRFRFSPRVVQVSGDLTNVDLVGLE